MLAHFGPKYGSDSSSCELHALSLLQTFFVFCAFHRTNITSQYSDPGKSGVQLNTLASSKAPRNTGNCHVSFSINRMLAGNTEMIAETGALFKLCTKQTSDPLLFQFGIIADRPLPPQPAAAGLTSGLPQGRPVRLVSYSTNIE
jgi:hypothetical protein